LSQALGNLNLILSVFSALIASLLSFPQLGFEFNSILPFTSVLVAMSFIFGGSAKALFDCIVFLFVVHPYDTGDRIFFDDGSNFVVEELRLRLEWMEKNIMFQIVIIN
jgi:hypothetical protein